MTRIRMEMFIELEDATARAFLQGTPAQRCHDLSALLEGDADISFSEPQVYHEDNRAADGAVPAGSHKGIC